jgi:pimeloyl-ACP methyl ester carboxylesterase
MVVGSEWRLTKALRDAAISGSTLTILTEAVVAQVQEALSPAPTGLGMAFADLAVTGRRAFADFAAIVPEEGGPIEAAATAKLSALGTSGVTPDLISQATSDVLDRAYQVAWFLRAETDRGDLGWIAVSGEDDLPHRPVNVPRTPFPQHDLYFTVPGDLGEVPVQTRFAIATSAEPPPPPALPPPGERSLPPVLEPELPDGDRIILFINGSDSRLEEANDLIPRLVRLPDGRPSGFSVLTVDLPGSGYASLIDHTDVGPWNPHEPELALLPFMEKFIIRFVDALSTRLGGPDSRFVESRLAAVAGGSLGGNLALWLARRKGPWVRNAVAWDAGSVWRNDDVWLNAGIVGATPRVGQDETSASRDDFFAGAFDQRLPFQTQPEQWYRDDWPAKQQYIAMARLDRRETYTFQYRRWHWRVSLEELMWTWQAPDLIQEFKSRILLGAGRDDDIWPAHIFTNTQELAAELKLAGTDGDTFFFDNTGHSVHAERPEALAGKIMAFLGKHASTDWTNFQVFQMPTRDPPGGLVDNLFAYKADDGTAAFHEIPSDLQNTNPVWEGTWRTDWTNLQIFPWGGRNFLFAYKAGDHTVAFDEIRSDLQDTDRLWEATWVRNWTDFQVFPWGAKNFLFSYASDSHTATLDEIDSELQGTTKLWEETWVRNWTDFQVFPWGGRNFLFSYASDSHSATLDEIDSDLQGTTNLWGETWVRNWTHFQVFPWGGRNFLFSYASDSHSATFDEIDSDLMGTTNLSDETWVTDWTHFQIFPSAGRYFLFAYASGDGTVAFDEIPSDLQGTMPIFRGRLATG